MSEKKIYWDKKYFEDLGEQNKDGFYDYVYYYHIYWFNMPNGQAIQVRRYSDTPNESSLFGIYDQQDQVTEKESRTNTQKLDFEVVHESKYIGAIINFLQTDGVKKQTYFDMTKGYCPIDMERVKTIDLEFERREIIMKTTHNNT